MTALDKIKQITAFLETCGIENAHIESEIILTHSLNIDKAGLYKDNPVLSEEDIKKTDRILERRAKREPLQYILGYIDFCGLKTRVGSGVLVPRPETELLVEEVIKIISYQLLATSEKKISSCCRVTAESYKLRVLDLCTGSGCLALAFAKEFPEADVYGTDISEIALRYAKENAEINGIKNATFLQGPLFEPIKKLFTLHSSPFTFDVIVSNPPYIKTTDIPNLQPEIRDWEPAESIDGGEDGLHYYKEILTNAREYLKSGGFIFLEIGQGQAKDVTDIAAINGFKNISYINDYCGIERIICIFHCEDKS